ncbi:MAG: hypothetical protein KGI99_17540 [Bradyrhizobium sp.]|nr:hypothetical protein [Bradyrhizobium sp.]
MILSRRWRLEQIVERAAVHQIGTDKSGKDERTAHGFLGSLGQPQQQESDQGNGDLDTHRKASSASRMVVAGIPLFAAAGGVVLGGIGQDFQLAL